jgi:hypothetical protein
VALLLIEIALDLKAWRVEWREDAAMAAELTDCGGEHPVGLHVDNSRMAQIFTPTWPAKES